MACTRPRRLIFCAAMACAAAFSVCASAVYDAAHIVLAVIHSAVLRVCDWAGAKIKTVLAKFAPHVLARPLVAIERAKAAVARAVRRKAVRLEAGWRMCPSV